MSPVAAPSVDSVDASVPSSLEEPTITRVSSISATELHEILMRANASGNVARKRFIDALRALAEQRLYLQLGFSDIVGCVEKTFHFRKSQTYEFLRVAEALEGLPKITAAYELGELSWSLVAELTRVAAEDTEEEWLEFVETHHVAETVAEIRDAVKKNRKRPRKNGNGLPGLPVRLRFEFSPQEYAIFERGLDKVADEMSASLDGARPEPEKVLLYLMDRMLHTEPGAETTDGRVERVDSPYTVVFHRCTDCHQASVESSQGRVGISAEAVDRIAGSAKCIEIDPAKEVPADHRSSMPAEAEGTERRLPASIPLPPKNTPALRRDLCARAGGRCENPFCRREVGEKGHGHHIRLRSRGGETALWSEVWCCRTCHANIHLGFLSLEGDPLNGFQWTPRAADITRRVREELEKTRALPEVRVIEPAEHSTSPESTDSPAADGPPQSTIDDAISALVGLGWTKAQAKARVARACDRLADSGEESVDVAERLAAAMRD